MATILIVDDTPAIRILVRATLEQTSHRLLEAADGESALEIARSRRPDLILLDVALPRMSGTDVCRELKRDPATADIRILFITGFAEPADRQATAEAGGQAFIEKPFSPAALLAEVKKALAARATVPAR